MKDVRPFLKKLAAETVGTQFFRQGIQMSLWRMVSLAFGMAGSIWAARCLGPENLGISGMIVTTTLQLALLVGLNQNALLIRRYKNDSPSERAELISTVFTFRATVTAALIVIAIPVLMLAGLPPRWHLGLCAAIPFFLFSVNLSDWILQSDGNLVANYKAMTIQSLTTAFFYLLFFRPGIGPGYDVMVQAFALMLAFAFTWRHALAKRPIRLYQWKLLPRIIPILKEGRWLAPTGLVVYIYVSLESPLIGYLYSIKELGVYRAATTLAFGAQSFLVMIPLLLYPRLIEWRKKGVPYLWGRQKSLALALAGFFLPVAVLVFLLAPPFYRLAYSPAFARAAYPFALLLISKFVVVLNGIFGWGLWAQHEDKKMLAVMTAVAVTSLTLNLIFIPHFGVMAAASINLTSELLILIATMILSWKIVRRSTEFFTDQPALS